MLYPKIQASESSWHGINPLNSLKTPKNYVRSTLTLARGKPIDFFCIASPSLMMTPSLVNELSVYVLTGCYLFSRGRMTIHQVHIMSFFQVGHDQVCTKTKRRGWVAAIGAGLWVAVMAPTLGCVGGHGCGGPCPSHQGHL